MNSEGDPKVQAMIRELEERYGYRVVEAQSTPEAWQAEASRLRDAIRCPERELLPAIEHELDALSRGEQTTEQALVSMVRGLEQLTHDSRSKASSQGTSLWTDPSAAANEDLENACPTHGQESLDWVLERETLSEVLRCGVCDVLIRRTPLG